MRGDSDGSARRTGPIGVFDSGVGGLSVLRDIRAALPHESLLFVADSGHIPYGDKPPAHVRDRALTLGRFLLAQRAKAIVIACNTATAAGATVLRAAVSVPVVAMEPAVKPATAATRTAVVGVLATAGTLRSARFAGLLERFGQGVEIVAQPAPGLVARVEAGDLDGPATRALVKRYTAPLLTAGADTIVLGSTHFSFLRSVIADVVGPGVTLIDTGRAVARELGRVLAAHDLLLTGPSRRGGRFWTSGVLPAARRIVSRLWGSPVDVRRLPDAFAA